jgi:hypothetical protein
LQELKKFRGLFDLEIQMMKELVTKDTDFDDIKIEELEKILKQF